MFKHAPHSFTPEQQREYAQRNGRPPDPAEIALYRGPVVHVSVAYNGVVIAGRGAPSPAAVALVDTGCDQTVIRTSSLTQWFQAAQKRTSLGPVRQQLATLLGLDVVFDLELSIHDPRNPTALHPLAVGSALSHSSGLKGYEDILLGRDILGELVFCISVDGFSLIKRVASTLANPHCI